MTRLSLSVLGALRVTLDGEPVTGFESAKARALLVYLAVEAQRPHPRDALAGLLWPEFPERAALSNLRYALSNLRKTIGDHEARPPFVLISGDSLQFNPASSSQLDAGEFADAVESDSIGRLEQAIALYQGAFLEGFTIADSAAFEEWLLLKREHFGRLMIRALRRLGSHYEQRGEYGQAQHYAWRQVELEPWQEEGHQQVMRVLALDGQRSAALAQYETCRRLLADELGVEPGAETTALYEQIRDGTLSHQSARMLTPPAFLLPDDRTGDAEYPLFVARDAELLRLNDFLNCALAGRGQVTFVIGEPGSGKTMLAQEFTRRALAAHPALIAVNGNCNAYTGIGDPYLPFLEMLDMLTGDVESRWSGGAITRDHARRLWRLLPDVINALVDHGPELIDRFVSGAGLLARAQLGAQAQAVRLDDLLRRKAASAGIAAGQQTDLFEQYTKVLRALARNRPLLLILDDLQWADIGSISLLFHLGRRLAGQRILIIGAYRPGEVTAGRSGERHPLEPVINELQRDYGDNVVDLSRSEGRQWIDALLDTEPNHLDTGFRETLYRHTGGHPLFTVELLRGLQGRGDLIKDEAGRWGEGAGLDWNLLPPRVEAVIAESVNRLPEALQTTLAIASVEGEFFTAQAVAYAQGVGEQEILHCLSSPLSKPHRLVSAANVQRVDGRHLSRYRFRHFLFQKYLYNRLDEVERARLHEALGNALEMLYADQSLEMAVQLARHFEAAGLIPQAVEHLHHAGDRAVRLFANTEAIAHYHHALRLLSTLPDTPECAKEELSLRAALRIPLETTQGYTSAELAQNNARARQLTRHAPDSPELFWMLTGLATYSNLRLSLSEARELAEDMLALANRLDDPALLLGACQVRSITALYEGQLETYFRYREQAHRLYDRQQHRELAFQFDADIEVAGLSHAGWAYWIQGYPHTARQQHQSALNLAEELGHPFSLAFARFFAGQMGAWCRDVPVTRSLAEAAIALSQEHGMIIWLNGGTYLLGWALAEESRGVQGVDQIEQAYITTRMIGAELSRIMVLPALAEAYARTGHLEKGLALLEEGLQTTQAAGFAMMEPEMHRCKGDLLLCGGGPEAQAEACFVRAIQSSRRIAARSWELRATLRLARLWRQQKKIAAAHDLLSAVYGQFTEGFDTPDLHEAQLLLDELAGQ